MKMSDEDYKKIIDKLNKEELKIREKQAEDIKNKGFTDLRTYSDIKLERRLERKSYKETHYDEYILDRYDNNYTNYFIFAVRFLPITEIKNPELQLEIIGKIYEMHEIVRRILIDVGKIIEEKIVLISDDNKKEINEEKIVLISDDNKKDDNKTVNKFEYIGDNAKYEYFDYRSKKNWEKLYNDMKIITKRYHPNIIVDPIIRRTVINIIIQDFTLLNLLKIDIKNLIKDKKNKRE